MHNVIMYTKECKAAYKCTVLLNEQFKINKQMYPYKYILNLANLSESINFKLCQCIEKEKYISHENIIPILKKILVYINIKLTFTFS